MLAGCDRVGEIVIVPELVVTDSFEGGLGAWTPASADLGDPPASWSAVTSSEAASAGNASAVLALANTPGTGKIWLVRGVELQPGRRYEIAIAFDVGTLDAAGTEPWRILAGAHEAPPESAQALVVQDPTPEAEGAGVTFVEKDYTLHATADEEGMVYLTIGVWGTTTDTRSFHFDDVRASFTRAPAN